MSELPDRDRRTLLAATAAALAAPALTGLAGCDAKPPASYGGEWGFILASRRPYRIPTQLPEGLRFISLGGLPALFDFPIDMARVPADVNRLSNQVLVQTFEEEWGKVHQ